MNTVRLIAVVLLSLVLAACEQAPDSVTETPQLVRVAGVKQGSLTHELSFHGVLKPVVRARLAFQTAGVVASRPAQLGQFVKQGELLATLDNPELAPAQRAAAARVQESLTRRDQARRELERLQALHETGAVGREQLEQKEAALESLEATVASAEADLTGTRQRLQDATLLAPFDGLVSSINVEPGEFVSAGQRVLAVGGLERLEVKVLVPASLVDELEPGDRLDVRIPQLNDERQEGRITELAGIGEVETGLFPVVVELLVDAEQTQLRAGMQAEVIFVYADVDGLIVPLSAIVDPVGGQPAIFLVENNRVIRHPVDIGAMSGDEVAFTVPSGAALADGDLVVVAGHRSLTEGQDVRVLQ